MTHSIPRPGTLIGELNAHHSLHYSMGRAGLMPDEPSDKYGYHDGEAPLRPLVKIHPETGRPSLNIGSHAHNIVGMDQSESEQLLDRINGESPAHRGFTSANGRPEMPLSGTTAA